ncbi:MAG: hypothetical protein Kow0068_01540 [Marinilabiliales bacterium]
MFQTKDNVKVIEMRPSPYLFILLIITIMGCKKYDEGPSISLRSKINRIEGKWYIEKFLINNADSTSGMHENFAEVVYFYNSDDEKYGAFVNDNFANMSSFDWSFQSDKEEILFNVTSSIYTPHDPEDMDTSYSYGPFSTNKKCVWNIKKLTKNALNLELDSNQINYRLELVFLIKEEYEWW